MLAAANGDQNAEFKVGAKSMGGPNLEDHGGTDSNKPWRFVRGRQPAGSLE